MWWGRHTEHVQVHLLTFWHKIQSCHLPSALAVVPGASQTPPRANVSPEWRSEGHRASRTNLLRFLIHYWQDKNQKTRVTYWSWALKRWHKDSWGLEGLRQTVASTYKRTRVGGWGGAFSTNRFWVLPYVTLLALFSQLFQTSEKSEDGIAPWQPGEQCMVKISLLLITTLTHVMIQMKATNQREK